MKRRGPSNIQPVAPWMTRLVAKPPEGTHTPDQIAKSLELCIALNDGDPAKVRSALHLLATKAPLAHQKWVRKLDHRNDEQMLRQVQAFIDITNEKLAQLQENQHDPEPEQPAPVFAQTSGDSQSFDWDSELDDGRVRKGPRSRGHRAIRSAKRQQTLS